MALSPSPLLTGTDNTALDGLFYDVSALSKAERDKLRRPGKVEGMILEVGPSWEPSLRVWDKLAQCEGLSSRYRAAKKAPAKKPAAKKSPAKKADDAA